MGSLMHNAAPYIRVVILVLFVPFVGAFSLAHIAGAQNVSTSTDTATSTGSSEEASEQRSEAGTSTENTPETERPATRTDAFREAFQEKREEFSDQRSIISQAVRDRLHNLFNNIMRRMHAAVERLDDIADRMESRAQKVAKDSGADISEAEQTINTARRELAAAREILRTLPEQADTAFSSEHPRERFNAVRVAVRNVGTHIRSAHQTLREAVAALKQAVETAQTIPEEDDSVQTDGSDLMVE